MALSKAGLVQIGTGVAADRSIIFDGNAQDWHIGIDDSADDLVIGLGNTVGTTPAISIDENLAIKIATNSKVLKNLISIITEKLIDTNHQVLKLTTAFSLVIDN